MLAKSAHTLETDPYRAGVALADQLREIDPELVFLFSSIDFSGSVELPEALHEVLDRPGLILIGSTGEGFMEGRKCADIGACALGINGAGAMRVVVSTAGGVARDTELAARKVLDDLRGQLGAQPDLVVMIADFHADGSAIERAIQAAGVPVVGGFAADDNFDMEKCYLYAGSEVLEDAIVAVGLLGGIHFDVHIAHNLNPVGAVGTITQSTRTHLASIDGMDAMDFVERAIGRPVSKVDQGIVTLNVLSAENPDKKYLRSIVPESIVDGEGFSLFGGIETGEKIQVCIAKPEEVIAEVYRVAETLSHEDFTAKAGLIFSCAGRKNLLGNKIEHEVTAVCDQLGREFAVAGFPTFGEIGPLRTAEGWSPSFFHNMTYVLLLLGD